MGKPGVLTSRKRGDIYKKHEVLIIGEKTEGDNWLQSTFPMNRMLNVVVIRKFFDISLISRKSLIFLR